MQDCHARLGHLHDRVVNQLTRLGKLLSSSFPLSGNNYKACALGKLTKFPLSPTKSISTSPLGLAITNICNPSLPLPKGHKYFVNFFFYFLNSRGCFLKFQKFFNCKGMVDHQLNCKGITN